MEKISYELLESVIRYDEWDSPLGALALYIESQTLPSKFYHDPKEHLRNFYNAYAVEKAFIDAFEGNLEWNEKETHEYLLASKGKYGCDMTSKDGLKVEVKMFLTTEKFDNWLQKLDGTYEQGYNCDVYLIYVRSTKKSFSIYTKEKDENGFYVTHKCKKQIEPSLL